jgi:phosphatidate cytidylyltransferase
MKSFITRTISAVIAISAFLALMHFFQADGIRIACFLAVVAGTYELIKILFRPEDSLTIKCLFYFLMIFIFMMSVRFLAFSSVIFASASIIFFSVSLLLRKKFDDLTALALFQSKSILGFLYLGLLPAFVCKILDLHNGVNWFVVLLIIVFSGDTSAYVFGKLWGKKKIMPNISPKKTYIGSLGGLVGSVVAAFFGSMMLGKPAWPLIIVGMISGTVAQFGDLFESMLKRVADVKDSGNIMPGHGGVLDRIDGVLFAGPFVYFFASIIEHYF